MDDSFSFRSAMPLRRRVDPWVVKGAVLSAIFVLGIGLFTGWVVASERASFAKRGQPVGPDVAVGRIDGPMDTSATDADAQESVRIALTAARAAFTDQGSFLDADPAKLSELQPGYAFVDGPSTTPTIVSVAAERHVWAAAALGASGTCFWIRALANGPVATGTSSECTGASALDGDGAETAVHGERPVRR
jgi:hypothetical protein